MTLLEVTDLSISFSGYAGRFGRQSTRALRGVELTVDAGEVVAVIGASGAGKSLLAHAILGILPRNAEMTGTIRYHGELLAGRRLDEARRNGEIAFVPQSVAFLDPLMRVGKQAQPAFNRKEGARLQREAFARYKLDKRVDRLYPHELSGGMARRVLVSAATIGQPDLLVADEPTPGMEEESVREALAQFRILANAGAGVLLITHDLPAALSIADKVAVFNEGTIVDIAPTGDFSGSGASLRHPYSRALWRALPQNDFAAPAEMASPNVKIGVYPSAERRATGR